ncbi:hypothetical protein J4Q44_G00232570 [Coregonus suidteri]|uniref:Uncharacterized protein n=1 Tax=Coregonus suidteri TaxID=861788 RepID=A0AAN8L6Q4_9TELE
MFNISIASRKLDQVQNKLCPLEMFQHLAKVNRLLVFSEINPCLCIRVENDQEQSLELFEGMTQDSPTLELDLANQWARRWWPTLLDALTSDVTLLQNNTSSHLLPRTLCVFPSAVEPLLARLDPASPGHLHAWAFVMCAHRPLGHRQPAVLQPKDQRGPTPKELSTMRTFIPQNLNRRNGKSDGGASLTKETEIALDQGVVFVDWLSQLPLSYLESGHSYQKEDCPAAAVCCTRDLHRHLEPRQEEGPAPRSVKGYGMGDTGTLKPV